jgi:hypothetical protein
MERIRLMRIFTFYLLEVTIPCNDVEFSEEVKVVG